LFKVVAQRISKLKKINKSLQFILDIVFLINSTLLNRIDQRGISYQQFGKNLVKGLASYNYNGLS